MPNHPELADSAASVFAPTGTQHAGDAQEEAWDAITKAAADAAGGSQPLRCSNVVLLASATA
jgi:hypothetical protein